MPDFDLVCMGCLVGKGEGWGEGGWGGGGEGEEIGEVVGAGDCGIVDVGGEEMGAVDELVTCWTTVKGCICDGLWLEGEEEGNEDKDEKGKRSSLNTTSREI